MIRKSQLTQTNSILACKISLKVWQVVDVVKLSGRAARVWPITIFFEEARPQMIDFVRPYMSVRTGIWWGIELFI